MAVIDTGANIADAICSYAKDNAIDLIVTGTHGRGAVQHFLMGSVAERVVRTAPCPALTVHAHERDFIVPDALAAMAVERGAIMDRILVLYGTSDGHTAMIARTIGDALTRRGFDADVLQAGTADPQPSDYAGIVVAGSIHAGGYQKAVGRWVRAHVMEFGGRPTAFVSRLPWRAQQAGESATPSSTPSPRVSSTPLGWHPTVSQGRRRRTALYTQYSFFKRWMMKRIVAKAGGDTDTLGTTTTPTGTT